MRWQTPDQAAAMLSTMGMEFSDAIAMVRRYSLKPGYQLSYTIGRRRFRRLYDNFCSEGKKPVEFARRVLALGEIDFNQLEQQLLIGE